MEKLQIGTRDDCNYETVRIPKNFSPLSYDLHFGFNFNTLTYNLEEEITLRVNQEDFGVLILNAMKDNYIIEEMSVERYDNISDHFVEETKLDSIYSVDLQEICNILQRKEFDNVVSTYDCFEITKLLNTVLKKEKPALNNLYIKLFDEERNSLLKYLINKRETNSLTTIEESIYIPLTRTYLTQLTTNSLLKLKLKLSGRIIFSSEKNCGLFFSLFGPESQLLENREEFMKIWKIKSKRTYLEEKAVITAVNEPVEARSYMPCFDEPSFKAKFKVRISVDSKYSKEKYFRVVSNGELIDVIHSNKLSTYIFSESPLMSVYLLTFVVGRYEYLETMVGETRLRVYTPPNLVDEGRFSLEIAQKSLEFYHKYFEVPYSFPKIDMVPVPDMCYRAMENWGCIVYLNYSLLTKPFQDIKERKNNARTTAHEMCHMWFGNLVTMDWWQDIWLNEGFARYTEFECLKNVKEEFQIWSKFFELIFQSAMNIDEHSSTHPVRCKVPSPRQLGEIFDTISYAKGASIIRMLSHYVGKENFRKAVKAYIYKYQYGNTVTKNLWDSFKETLGVDVEPVMDCWLNLSGHPLVKVSLVEIEYVWYINLKQSPYPENFNKEVANPIWKIPIFVKTKHLEFCIMFDEPTMKIKLDEFKLTYQDLKEGNDFIKINRNMKGFYRVYYQSNDLLTGVVKNYNLLKNYDICGLLFDYTNFQLYTQCLYILESIKPIKDALTLTYVLKLYSEFKSVTFQHSCFLNIIEIDSSYIKEFRQIVNLELACRTFFGCLVEVDKTILLEKIYLVDSSHYLNERNDEFLEDALHFYSFIQKDEELIRYVVENFEKGHVVIHKNLRYAIYAIITGFSFYVLKDEEKESKLYNILLQEYIDNFYDLSVQARTSFKSALLNFKQSSLSLVKMFLKKMNDDPLMKNIYFKNTDFFYNYPNNRSKFLTAHLELFKESYLINSNKNFTFLQYLKLNGKTLFEEFDKIFKHIFYVDLKKMIVKHIEKELLQIKSSYETNEIDNENYLQVVREYSSSLLNDKEYEAYIRVAKDRCKTLLSYFKM